MGGVDRAGRGVSAKSLQRLLAGGIVGALLAAFVARGFLAVVASSRVLFFTVTARLNEVIRQPRVTSCSRQAKTCF